MTEAAHKERDRYGGEGKEEEEGQGEEELVEDEDGETRERSGKKSD